MRHQDSPRTSRFGKEFADHWARVVRRWQTGLETQRALRAATNEAAGRARLGR